MSDPLGQPKVKPFYDWAVNELSYCYHEDGAVEAADRVANNTAKALSRLLDTLIKSKQVGALDAEYIVSGYRRNKD